MENFKYHLKIPKENIRNEKFEKNGFGQPFKRLDYGKHGQKLYDQTTMLKTVELKKKDSEFIKSFFFQIETPKGLTVKSEKTKFENMGLELISYSLVDKSIGIAKIPKKKLVDFEKRVLQYSQTTEHIGRSYFSSLENISSIPYETKLKIDFDIDTSKKMPVVINLFNALSYTVNYN